MIKKIFILALFFTTLQADLLDDKIKNLIGEKKFIVHKNLLESLTQNRGNFYIRETLHYTPLLNILKSEGLIDLDFGSPKDVSIKFIIDKSHKKGLKILKDTLSTLGYTYYFTDYLKNENNILEWKIKFKSEFMLDPYIFNRELTKIESRITDITKISNYEWLYKINVENSRIYDSIKIEKNEKVKLLKPLKPYLLEIDEAKEIVIISRKLNNWFPKLAFFDKELKVLAVIEKTRMYRGVKIPIPQNTRYVKVDDSFTLLNIKRGLTVIVK
jgi:hypothetical protein